MDPTKPGKKACAKSQNGDASSVISSINININVITVNGSAQAVLTQTQLETVHPALEQLQLGSHSGARSPRTTTPPGVPGSNPPKRVSNGKSAVPSPSKPAPVTPPIKTAVPAKVVGENNPQDSVKTSVNKNTSTCSKTSFGLNGRNSASTSSSNVTPSGVSKSKSSNGSNSPARSSSSSSLSFYTPSTSMASLAGSDITGDSDENVVITVNATKDRAGGLLKIRSSKVVYFYSIDWSSVFIFPPQELDKYEMVNTLMAVEIFAQIVRIHLRNNPNDGVKIKCCNNFYNANDKKYRGDIQNASYKQMLDTVKEKLANPQFKGIFCLSNKKNMDMKIADKLSSIDYSHKGDVLPIVSVQNSSASYLSDYDAHNFSVSHLSVLHTIAFHVPKSIKIEE